MKHQPTEERNHQAGTWERTATRVKDAARTSENVPRERRGGTPFWTPGVTWEAWDEAGQVPGMDSE